MRRQVQFLVDHRDAATPCVQRVMRLVGPSFELDFARVRSVGAAQNLHERALARAILPDQGVDFARADLKGNGFERPRCPERFLHSGHAQPRAHGSAGRPGGLAGSSGAAWRIPPKRGSRRVGSSMKDLQSKCLEKPLRHRHLRYLSKGGWSRS